MTRIRSDSVGIASKIASVLLQPRDETGIELYGKTVICDCSGATTDILLVEPGARSYPSNRFSLGERLNIKF